MNIKRSAKALRLGEAFIMTGFIIIGAVYGVQQINEIIFEKLFLIPIISYFLMISIYSTNSLLGYNSDKNNIRLKDSNVASKRFYLIFSIISYSISFILCLLIKTELLTYHIIIFLLWFLYALPGFGKHVPVLGTIIHFFVAIVQFNFAYLFFSPISISSVLISAFYALLISAGHLHHEIIDYEADKNNKINTSTVLCGIKYTKIISLFIFGLAHVFWILLFFSGIISLLQLLVFCCGFLLHLIFFFKYSNSLENNINNRLKYRFLYRLIYFFCGSIITIEIFFF